MSPAIPRALRALPLIAALALGAGAPAAAAVIYDSGVVPQVGGPGLGATQFLAGRFGIGSALTITDLEAYLTSNPGSALGAEFQVKIYDGDNLPETELFSSTVISTPGTGWQGAHGLTWLLDPGVYWLAFEVEEPGFSGWISGQAPNPLGKYAFEDVGARPWLFAGPIDISLRISGEGGAPFDTLPTAPIPEPATWAMMIVGFGLAGSALRVRRRLAPLSQ